MDAKYYLLVVLIYISLMTGNIKHLFMCLFAICTSSSVKCLFIIFCPFSNWIVYVFTVEFGDFLHSGYKVFVGYVVCKYFLSVCNLFFHPLYRVFHRAKVLNVYKTQFINFSFYDVYFLVSSVGTPHFAPGPKVFLLSFYLWVLSFYIWQRSLWPILS